MDKFDKRLDAAYDGMTWGKAFKYGSLAIALVIGLGVVGKVTGLIGAVIGAATGVISRTLEPDSIIATYEGFHDRWKAFESRRAQIASYAMIVDFATGSEKTTAMIEQQAMMQSCRDIAARYNADSAKTNRVIFKGKEAPETLNMELCQ